MKKAVWMGRAGEVREKRETDKREEKEGGREGDGEKGGE